jgi:phage terminase large subunit-like protein
VVVIIQAWKVSGAIKTAEGKLADRTLIHGGQGPDGLAVSNARVEPKGNAVITKQASGSATIDPLMAAFNAIALMSTNPWSARPNVFLVWMLDLHRREGEASLLCDYRTIERGSDS